MSEGAVAAHVPLAYESDVVAEAVAEPEGFWIELEGSGSGRCEVLNLVDLDDTAELIVDEVGNRLLAADLAREQRRVAAQLVMDRR